MSVKKFINANVIYNGQPSKYRTVCRVLAIATLPIAQLCVFGLCGYGMCRNVRWVVRDFALNVGLLSVCMMLLLGLRITVRACCCAGFFKCQPVTEAQLKKMRIYSSASIAVNMLFVRLFV